MKKILSYIIMGILGVTVFTACSDDESYPTPTALDASTLSYEAKAGAVKLKWKIPENANYKYIKVTYTLPESGKECLRLAISSTAGMTWSGWKNSSESIGKISRISFRFRS